MQLNHILAFVDEPSFSVSFQTKLKTELMKDYMPVRPSYAITLPVMVQIGYSLFYIKDLVSYICWSVIWYFYT